MRRPQPEIHQVEVFTIGTELLLGFTVDTNSAYIGQRLATVGIRVTRRTAVADDAEAIRDALGAALDRTGAVIVTGGLGPTSDDFTRTVVADLLAMPLEFDQTVWDNLLARFSKLGRQPSESNRCQAMVPRGGTVLPNRWGSAPGLWLPSSRGLVILLPGVPNECRRLLDHEVLPRLEGDHSGNPILSTTLRTTGIAESALGELIGPLEESLLPITVAYLPDVVGVDVRLTSWQSTASEGAARLAGAAARVREVAANWIYGEEDADLAAVVLEEVRNRSLSLAVAESCTGGLLGGRLTAIAGASDVFRGGVISYANEIKTGMLGVDPGLLEAVGAVSIEVAAAMAQGAASRLGASVGVGITGIAGPSGGSPEKPVGTVCFGFSVAGRLDSAKAVFLGNRDEVRARAVQAALMGVLRRLRGETR